MRRALFIISSMLCMPIMAKGAFVAIATQQEQCIAQQYVSFSIGEKSKVSLGSSLIDFKVGVCIKAVLTLKREMININKIQLNTEGVLDIEEGQTAKQFMGTDKDGYGIYVKVDSNGKVLEFDGFEELVGKTIFKSDYKLIVTPSTLSQEIVYTGHEGNIVHLLYREYVGDLIKAPFIQNLIVDLSKGKLVNIKGFNIEIINADNTGIEFIVK